MRMFPKLLELSERTFLLFFLLLYLLHLQEIMIMLNQSLAFFAKTERGTLLTLVSDSNNRSSKARLAFNSLMDHWSLNWECFDGISSFKLDLNAGNQSFHSFVDLLSNSLVYHIVEVPKSFSSVVPTEVLSGWAFRGRWVIGVMMVSSSPLPFFWVFLIFFLRLFLDILSFVNWAVWFFLKNIDSRFIFFLSASQVDAGFNQRLVWVDFQSRGKVALSSNSDVISLIIEVGECILGRRKLEFFWDKVSKVLISISSFIDLDGLVEFNGNLHDGNLNYYTGYTIYLFKDCIYSFPMLFESIMAYLYMRRMESYQIHKKCEEKWTY